MYTDAARMYTRQIVKITHETDAATARSERTETALPITVTSPVMKLLSVEYFIEVDCISSRTALSSRYSRDTFCRLFMNCSPMP